MSEGSSDARPLIAIPPTGIVPDKGSLSVWFYCRGQCYRVYYCKLFGVFTQTLLHTAKQKSSLKTGP